MAEVKKVEKADDKKSEAVAYSNPQVARRCCPVIPTPNEPNKGDIVEYVRKNKVRKVGEGEDDFVVEEVVVEASRVNRQAYIAKDAQDVGVLNILEKVRRSGDITLLNQIGATYEASGEVDSLGRPLGKVQDYTNAPSSIGEALNAVASGANSFAGLKAIFGDVSFADLANMSEEQIQAYLQSYIAATQTPKEENK